MSRQGDEWISAGLLVIGGLGSVIALLSWLAKDLTVILAFTAGAGWMLSIPLLVMLRRANTNTDELKTELKDYQQQIGEWRAVATRDSESLNTLIVRAVEVPRVVTRRQTSAHLELPEGQPNGD